MKRIVFFKISKGVKFYTAECLDLPIITQGKNLDELMVNIAEALSLSLDGENLVDWELHEDFSVLINYEMGPFHA